MIYLNNAATSWPKPKCVRSAYLKCLDNIPAGQFRSSTVPAENGNIQTEARRQLAALFNAPDANRIFFTSGATESANMIVSGIDWNKIHVVTTVTEHNSILRPLKNHNPVPVNTTFVDCDKYGFVDPQHIEAAIRPNTKVIIVNHCSNVTGAIQNLTVIGQIAKKYGLIFIVDASQSAGCIPIDIQKQNIAALIFTGHKSLYGVPGTGGLYISNRLSIRPLKFGGTGTHSSELSYTPDTWEYEPGTQNIPGIAALAAGVQFLRNKGIASIKKKETTLITYLAAQLSVLPSVTVHTDTNRDCGPVLSFTIKGLPAADIGYILNGSYGIIVRTGLQCAPLIHPLLGTAPEGTVRVSISYMTTKKDIAYLVDAIRDICKT